MCIIEYHERSKKVIENYFNTRKIIETIELRMEAIRYSEDSLKKEKENLLLLKEKLDEIVKQIEIDLKQLTGIHHKLYYEMVVNGINPNKAVEKVSIYQDVSVSTIWKKYYPIVKEKINELKKR